MFAAAIVSGLGSQVIAADYYWRTDLTAGTFTGPNWNIGSATATGGTAWANATSNHAYFTANSTVTGAAATVGNVFVSANRTVVWTGAGSWAAGGVVHTIDVGTGGALDQMGQDFSAAAGSGFIKNGNGVWYNNNGGAYTGGFTLNAGTIVLGSVNAMGIGGILNINGGTLAASANRAIPAGKYTAVNIGGDFQIGGITTVLTNEGSSSATISIADAVSLGAANRKITIGTNGLFTFSNNITATGGTVGLTLDATSTGTLGVLSLGGTNTYGGNTAINAGTLVAAKPASLPGYNTTGKVTVSSGGALSLGVGTGEFTSGNIATALSNVTLNNGALFGFDTTNLASGYTYDGSTHAANLGFVKTGLNTLTLTGNATYAGATRVAGGILLLNGGNNTLPTTTVVELRNASGGATLNLNGITQTVAGLTGGGSIGGTVTLGTNGVLIVNNASANTYDGVITGATGKLIKTGTGSLTLGSNGGNTYGGGTEIRNGTVNIGTVNSVGSGTVLLGIAGGGDVTLSSRLAGYTYTPNIIVASGTGGTSTLGSTSTFNSTTYFSGTVTLNGDLTLRSVAPSTTSLDINLLTGAGGITKVGTGRVRLQGASNYLGNTTISQGELRIMNNDRLPVTTAVSLANVSGANLDVNNFAQTIASLSGGGTTGGNVSLGTGTLTINEAGSNSYGGVINGTGGKVIKSGVGTLTLTNANTYSGGTTITAGSIRANNLSGSATGSGAVAVSGTGRLGGRGTIINTAPITVGSGGTITAGENDVSVGSLKTGAQKWDANGNYEWKIKSGGNNPSDDTGASNPVLAGGSWDLIKMDSLDLSSLGGDNKFTIVIKSFANSTTPGELASDAFDPTSSARFLIASVTTPFARPTNASDLFAIDASDFYLHNPNAVNGTFSISFGEGGGDISSGLFIDYAATPEPTTALLFGLGSTSLLAARRRNQVAGNGLWTSTLKALGLA